MDEIKDTVELLPSETFVSRTGTRHVIGSFVPKPAFGRIAALCGFTIRPEDGQPAGVRDCEFCLVELAAIRRRAEREASKIVAISDANLDEFDPDITLADVRLILAALARYPRHLVEGGLKELINQLHALQKRFEAELD